jgi:hypothetical protein
MTARFHFVRLTGLLVLVAYLSGCAFGTKMSYDKTALAVPRAQGDVAVGVWDARPYVLSGEKSPQWVGLQRSGFAIPYGVHTQSGAPLRKEFAQTIVSSFNRSGVAATTIDIPDQIANRGAVERLLPATGTSILLEITNWKTDVLADVHFAYDMTLRVFNNGVKVAEERVNGDEKLRGSFWNPIGASERVAVAKQKEKLDQLFGSSRVRAALDGGNSVQPAQFDQRPTLVSTQPKASEVSEVKVSPTHEQRAGTRLEACSIEQVLSMKGSGLSDSQIKAACAETGK